MCVKIVLNEVILEIIHSTNGKVSEMELYCLFDVIVFVICIMAVVAQRGKVSQMVKENLH